MKEIKRAKTASHDEVDSFLKGSNPMEHVIKVECGYDDKYATVIWRDENYIKHYDEYPFYPFCWAKAAAGQSMCKGDRTKLKLIMQEYGITCKGLVTANENGEVPERMANGYTVMFYATKPMTNQKFTKFFDEVNVPLKPKEKHWSYGKNYYKCVAPNEQFMISTGIRLFKGYDSYDDIKRMQFDIETSGLDAKTDTLDQIGIRTNKGFEKIITVTGNTPEEYFNNAHSAMCEFYDIVAKEDPDVVAGYNSENFDWNFFDVFGQEHYNESLAEMSKRPGLEHGIYKKSKQAVLKLGGEMEYYTPTVMWGKHIADCLFSVRRAQALDSNMKKATLKYVTKYSKINKENRVYVPGKIINTTWSDLTPTFAFNDENGHWFKITDEIRSKRVILRIETGSHVEERRVDNINDDLTKEQYEYYKSCGNTFEKDGITYYIDDLYVEDDEGGQFYIMEYHYIVNDTVKDYEEKDGGLKYTFNDDKIIDNETEEEFEYKTGRYIVQRYLLDDLWETDKVELRYNESNFLVGKMLPVNFERMCTMGTATIWKYIMMAWSYEHDLAIPLETSSRSFTGGLSRLLTVGYIPNVQKLDYNSLYPSIILTFGIKSPIDISGAMPAMLEYILTQREYFKGLKGKYGKEAKKYGKEVDSLIESLKSNEEYMGLSSKAFGKAIANHPQLRELRDKQFEAAGLSTRNDKMQLPLKITANAFFGSFGAGGGIFNWADMDCAEETTCCGRQMLRLMLKWFTDLGYSGIVCDSVTWDTPLFIKTKDNLIDIKYISELFCDDNFITKKSGGREYDYTLKDYKVLCRSGWVEPKYLYRHKTDKDIYRVDDENESIVDVTKDHSLFDENKNEIKPEEINNNTKLEYYNNENIYVFNTINLSNNAIKMYYNMIINHKIDYIPIDVLNSNFDNKKMFLVLINENNITIDNYSKKIVAGVNFIRNSVLV